MAETLPSPVVELCEQTFVDKGRDVVLAALDEYVQGVVGHPGAKGWRDDDLPSLFAALDRHLKATAARLTHPDSAEPGSARVGRIG